MKKFLFVALALLALPTVARAIDLGPGSATFNFATAVPVADFSSTGVALAGDANTVGTQAQLDAFVQALTASQVGTALITSTTQPPSSNATFRQNLAAGTGEYLQSNPATASSVVVGRATLTNSSSNYISGVTLNYTLNKLLDAAEVETEEVPGMSVYYSTTGAANSWNFLGTTNTVGPVNFNITGLAHQFGNNPMYVLWADDNAVAGSTAGEVTFTLDDMTFGRTLGDPLVITPVFGTLTPNQSQTFETPGTGLPANNGAQGTVTTINGTQALQVNGTALNATTDQVDLRGVAGQTKTVGVNLKAWETSQTSDFEAADHVIVTAEYSNDGITFQNLDLVNVAGAPALSPFDPLVPNPADQVRATFGPTEAVNNATEAFKHFQVTLPGSAQTVRVHVNLSTDSTSEFMAVDNITVSAAPVPEPATVAMFGLGMIGLVGYGVRRRRSA